MLAKQRIGSLNGGQTVSPFFQFLLDRRPIIQRGNQVRLFLTLPLFGQFNNLARQDLSFGPIPRLNRPGYSGDSLV